MKSSMHCITYYMIVMYLPAILIPEHSMSGNSLKENIVPYR